MRLTWELAQRGPCALAHVTHLPGERRTEASRPFHETGLSGRGVTWRAGSQAAAPSGPPAPARLPRPSGPWELLETNRGNQVETLGHPVPAAAQARAPTPGHPEEGPSHTGVPAQRGRPRRGPRGMAWVLGSQQLRLPPPPVPQSQPRPKGAGGPELEPLPPFLPLHPLDLGAGARGIPGPALPEMSYWLFTSMGLGLRICEMGALGPARSCPAGLVNSRNQEGRHHVHRTGTGLVPRGSLPPRLGGSAPFQGL